MNTEAFKAELEQLINKHSIESGSDTPDFILCNFLMAALESYNVATRRRAVWYDGKGVPGHDSVPVETDCSAPECGCESSSGCCST